MQLSLVPPTTDSTAADAESLQIQCSGTIANVQFQLVDPLDALLGADGIHKRVFLDLDQVSYIDSSGISWLIHNQRRFAEAKGQLTLQRVPPVVMQVLRFCRLDHFFDIQNQ